MRFVDSAARPITGGRRGFTLVELLIVIAILGILAALVIPRFQNVQAESAEASVQRQLQIVRAQIEVFRSRNSGADPDMSNWDDLVDGDYLQAPALNPLNNATAINGDGDFSGGWIWRDDGTGENQMYATDATQTVELPY